MRFRIPSRWAPYVLVSPFLVLFAVFSLFPLLFSLWLAFQSWEPTSGLEAMQFVGLDNFVFALTDGWFWKSLKNTLWLAVASGLPQHLVALPLAVLLHQGLKRWRGLVSGAYFLPYITSTVAIAMLFGTRPIEGPLLAMLALNPVDIARVLLLLGSDTAAMLGATGAVLARTLGDARGQAVLVLLLVAWVALPVWWSVRTFARKDF